MENLKTKSFALVLDNAVYFMITGTQIVIIGLFYCSSNPATIGNKLQGGGKRCQANFP